MAEIFNSILKLRQNCKEFVNSEVIVKGIIYKSEIKSYVKNGVKKHFVILYLSDYSESISVLNFNDFDYEIEKLQNRYVKIVAKLQYNNRKYDYYLSIKSFTSNHLIFINPLFKKLKDNSKLKRVELHAHSKMSTMDGVILASDLIDFAFNLGHSGIAITDLKSIQAFPLIQEHIEKNYTNKDFKVVFGCEFGIIDYENNIVLNSKNKDLNFNYLNKDFVLFDLETSGLSANFNKIIEFGAIKYNFLTKSSESLSFLIKQDIKIDEEISKITNLSNFDLEKYGIEEKLAAHKIFTFIKNAILVAHNAKFDFSFLKQLALKYNFEFDNIIIDSLELSKFIFKDAKKFSLKGLIKYNKLTYFSTKAHRALYDAQLLLSLFKKIQLLLNELNILTFAQLKKVKNDNLYLRSYDSHLTILAQNQEGIKNLFKLVSISHTSEFYDDAKLFKKTILKHKDGLLIGSSGCFNSEIFNCAFLYDLKTLEEKMHFYDYIEINPIPSYLNLVYQNKITLKNLKLVLKKIIYCAKKLNKIVIASGNVKYIYPYQKKQYEVFIFAKRIQNKRHPLFSYDYEKNKEFPDFNFYTTKMFLDDLNYLNDLKLQEEIVITNPNLILSKIKKLKPLKKRLYIPFFKDVDLNLRKICYSNATKQYGNNLDLIIKERLETELSALSNSGYSVVYWIAYLLVKKSLSDGYIVGSRGSVGSSLVATLAKITEINPLPAHYYCLKCHYIEFVENCLCGYDLKPKNCPNCKILLKQDGHNIPFETFLGFDYKKIPDIDLNFSNEYQKKAHDFVRDIFGINNVFRAGTISTLAFKSAFGYVKFYFESKYPNSNISNLEVERLALLCEGTKRTTGQHPGGLIIVPYNFEINDFTPINYPADDKSSNWLTTHFDFHAIHNNLLKLDLLGHVDPTALRHLEILTKVNPLNIPTYDPKILSLFSSNQNLNFINQKYIISENATFGLPEFGTKFVNQILKVIKPKKFSDLVKISGLSHGKMVWEQNAKNLILEKNIQLNDLIGCRDDIMIFLISKGINKASAFTMMEKIRKGQKISNQEIKLLQDFNVPSWYIKSCLQISYLFPKAHASAYVLMAWRIAFYKLYYPYEYYATFFTTRTNLFDIETISKGAKVIFEKLEEFKKRKKLNVRDKELKIIYQVALEMWNRGIKMSNISLKHSTTTNFVIEKEENGTKIIIPPFIAMNGLGINIAISIVNARKTKKNNVFASIEDLVKSTSINKNHLKFLKDNHLLDDLPTSNQKTIFDF